MKNVFVLAMLAGTAVSSTAFAQELPPLPLGGEVRIDPVGYPAAGGYDSRSIQPVYDCLSNSFGNGSATHLGTCSQILEDVSFQNGPWATATTKLMTEITYGLGVISTPTTVTDHAYFIFWPKSAVNYQGFGGANTNMINPAAVPIAILNVNASGLGAGFYWQITNSLTGFPGGGITIPAADDGFYLQVAWITLADPTGAVGYTPTTSWSVIDTNATGGLFAGCASATDRALVFGSNTGAALPGNPASPGLTAVDYGRDISNAAMCANIGQFIGNGGAAAGSGNVEHRFINASPARGFLFRAKGDVTAPLPTPVTSLGCAADAGSTTVSTVASSGVKWYSLCLNNGAADASGTFLDLDTEGSASDVTIGIFDGSGALIANDDGSGSGTNDQLTFGVGIRASAGGDGLQYNGRSGELAATAGGPSYYIAVAPTGSTFGSGFTVTSAAGGGSFNLNMHTNTNGTPLAPSVTPAVSSANQLGDIVSPGAAAASAATGLKGTLWYSFQVSFDTSCSTRFLDIDFNGSGATATADTEAYVFNSAGTLIAFDDDSGPAGLSQLSFNQNPGGPADRPSVGGDGLTHSGQNGNIAPGTYYMGVGLFAINALTTQDRFHLRATSGSNLTIAPVWSTDFDGTNGCTSTCTTCVGDYNQDGGIDGSDISAFFPDWENSAACADVNQDGGVDGGDIEFFFTKWENSAC
jgi:hypothetical protein